MSVPPNRNGGPGLPRLPNGLPAVIAGGLLGYLSTRSTNAAQIAEAQKNRDFQKEMSDTSLQRSTRDAILAGINPIFVAGRGASTPGGAQADIEDAGEGVGRGVGSALAVRQARANVDLTESQAMKTRVEAADLETQGASGRYEIIRNQADRGVLDVDQARQLLPLLVERAGEELRLAGANVEAVKARALLDKYAASGAFNEAEFQRYIGTLGPAGKALVSVLKAVPRGGAKITKFITIGRKK